MSGLFELERVTLRREGRTVLDGVDAVLPEGVSCIWGPSGAGKSTLLRLLDRLLDPDEGVVRYRGDDVRGLDPLALRRAVALVPQLPALVARTVEENVAFGPSLRGTEVDVARLLVLAGLDAGYAPREAGSLSVGEQQRVMLARALALEPDVLLLDEPTAALDADARSAVEETVLHLRAELGVSCVLVTHDRAQAERLAGWVVGLSEGRCIRVGKPLDVLTGAR
jgi:putative ABC transport system ATP-binding protein